jgi:hypothetical protein
MHLMRRATALLLPLLTAFALGGCDDTTGSRSARVSILLTDAPGDLAEAWVRVDRIDLQGSASEDGGDRVYLLDEQTEWVDLLTLSGGRTAELVGDAAVPAGQYGQLRFVVCDAWVRTTDDRVFATRPDVLPAGVAADGTLHVPSACQSGFKVNLPGGGLTLSEGSTILVVDFDVSQSFGHQAGHSGRWVMRPVMHATHVGLSGAVRGTVTLGEGVALPACGGGDTDLSLFVPRAVAGADTVSGSTAADGAFSIAPLHPATYGLTHAHAVTFTNGDTLRLDAAVAPPSVSVASGAHAAADYTVTGAECRAGS